MYPSAAVRVSPWASSWGIASASIMMTSDIIGVYSNYMCLWYFVPKLYKQVVVPHLKFMYGERRAGVTLVIATCYSMLVITTVYYVGHNDSF